MRTFAALFLLALVTGGCVHDPERARSKGIVFNIRSSDVVSASAEPLDSSLLPGHEIPPFFKAQLHIVLNDDATERFRGFQERQLGNTFELRVNGEVLLAAVYASECSGSDMHWFVISMDEGERFAASLNKR